ncbi:MAG: hypothetical protein ACW99G_05335 [Candidatus Thorarchaeota archaeon]|jgi:hypothetical protein
MTKREIPTSKEVFKVLVVGEDILLQTGFLKRISGNSISYQLYNTLGVSFGVSSFDYPNNLNVILQLWSLPSTERVRGITRSYVKGHSAVIVIVRPKELRSIPRLLQDLSLTSETMFIIAVVGSVVRAEDEINKLCSFFDFHPTVQALTSVNSVVRFVSDNLVKRDKSRSLPLIGVLSVDECPSYEPQPPVSYIPPISGSSLIEIRNGLVSRKSLLEVAEERLREGRLSEAGYSMLKKKVNNLEALRS